MEKYSNDTNEDKPVLKTDAEQTDAASKNEMPSYREPGEAMALVRQAFDRIGYINRDDQLNNELEKAAPGRWTFHNEFWQRYLEITADMILGESLTNHPLIIGVDKSGRYGALFMKNFLDRLSEINNGEGPNVLFFAGHTKEHGESKIIPTQDGDLEKIEIIKDSIRNNWRPNNSNDRVLITEDVVDAGSSLRLICRALEELGIGYDLSIETNGGLRGDRNMKQYIDKLIIKPRQIFSTLDYSTDAVSRGRSGVGVYKKEGDLFSRRTVGSDDDDKPRRGLTSIMDDDSIRDEVIKDRIIIKLVAERIAEFWLRYFKYLKEHPAEVAANCQ
jgi:hypothetical protein